MSVANVVAPGRLGVAASPGELALYVQSLHQWLAGRKAELDAIDAESLRQGPESNTSPDIALSMALWQAIVTRSTRLNEVWNGGAVGPAERLEMTSLIWGRLDDAPGHSSSPLGASLPEAMSLSDALAASLRSRLSMGADAPQIQHRLSQLAAQLERLRTQAALEPPSELDAVNARVATLATRLEYVREAASRGGDVEGTLAPLELTAAQLERDLIVGGDMRRRKAARRDALEATLADLRTREAHVRQLADEAAATVDPAPKYAVPDVSQLGPIPDEESRWAEFEAKLAKVGKALAFVANANAAASAELSALRERFARVSSQETDVAARTREVLSREPVSLGVAGPLVAALEALSRAGDGREM